MLPDYTFHIYSQRGDFRLSSHFSAMSFDHTFNEKRSRRGLGMPFHEFELCLETDLNSVVKATFCDPLDDDELFLVDAFKRYDIKLPDLFACKFMHFAISKRNI
jgi:hypothetical protein